MFYRKRVFSSNNDYDLPWGLHLFELTLKHYKRFQVHTSLYPLLFALGFFFFWTFDKTLLSLFWIGECFILFLVSIITRESQFRIVSMLGIAIVFFRIVLFDLVGSNFFIKAIVFMSVGAILITMNTIYNRYKMRFETIKEL